MAIEIAEPKINKEKITIFSLLCLREGERERQRNNLDLKWKKNCELLRRERLTKRNWLKTIQNWTLARSFRLIFFRIKFIHSLTHSIVITISFRFVRGNRHWTVSECYTVSCTPYAIHKAISFSLSVCVSAAHNSLFTIDARYDLSYENNCLGRRRRMCRRAERVIMCYSFNILYRVSTWINAYFSLTQQQRGHNMIN